jgi:hypothetical protein
MACSFRGGEFRNGFDFDFGNEPPFRLRVRSARASAVLSAPSPEQAHDPSSAAPAGRAAGLRRAPASKALRRRVRSTPAADERPRELRQGDRRAVSTGRRGDRRFSKTRSDRWKLSGCSLQSEYPGDFHDNPLRTLHRRVGQWRTQKAQELVFGVHDGVTAGRPCIAHG